MAQQCRAGIAQAGLRADQAEAVQTVLRDQVLKRQPAAAPLQDHRRRGALLGRPAADDLADQLDREALMDRRRLDSERAAQHDMLADRFRPLVDRAAELDAALGADQLAEQVARIGLGPGVQALDPALDQDLAGRPLDPDLVQQGLDDQRRLVAPDLASASSPAACRTDRLTADGPRSVLLGVDQALGGDPGHHAAQPLGRPPRCDGRRAWRAAP